MYVDRCWLVDLCYISTYLDIMTALGGNSSKIQGPRVLWKFDPWTGFLTRKLMMFPCCTSIGICCRQRIKVVTPHLPVRFFQHFLQAGLRPQLSTVFFWGLGILFMFLGAFSVDLLAQPWTKNCPQELVEGVMGVTLAGVGAFVSSSTSV